MAAHAFATTCLFVGLLLPVQAISAQKSEARKVAARVEWTSGLAVNALKDRTAFAVKSLGHVFVPVSSRAALAVFGATGSFLGYINVEKEVEGERLFPTAVAIDPLGRLWVRLAGGSHYLHFRTSARYSHCSNGEHFGPRDVHARR